MKKGGASSLPTSSSERSSSAKGEAVDPEGRRLERLPIVPDLLQHVANVCASLLFGVHHFYACMFSNLHAVSDIEDSFWTVQCCASVGCGAGGCVF